MRITTTIMTIIMTTGTATAIMTTPRLPSTT